MWKQIFLMSFSIVTLKFRRRKQIKVMSLIYSQLRNTNNET
jgi:hypothetical protein